MPMEVDELLALYENEINRLRKENEYLRQQNVMLAQQLEGRS